MIDLIKEEDTHFITLGFDSLTKTPKRKIPITHEELVEIATLFTEEFANTICQKGNTWSLGSYKLTKSFVQPKRTMLHYNEASWHMSPKEIALIGNLAQRVIETNE